MGMQWETMWEFRTRNFTVLAQIVPDEIAPDFDDEETMAGIESGKYAWFASRVVVLGPDGQELGADHLGGSAYANPRDFFTDHRTASADGRNTLASKSRGVRFCHYFPGMVAEAVSEARKAFAERKRAIASVKLRAAA